MWHKLSVLALFVSITGMISVAGCGGSNKEFRIAVIPKGTGHVFWKSIHAGALKAANELGDTEILWQGPQVENDTKKQAEVVSNFITARVSGICLAPNLSTGLVGPVKEANSEGIPVVIYDSGLGEGAEFVSYVATNNYVGGEIAADALAKELGGKGNVIMLRYQPGSESTEQREEGFLDKLKKDHPGIKVISKSQHGGENKPKAMLASTNLLDSFAAKQIKIDGVFAVCESNCEGMLAALEQAGKAGEIKFLAFDPSEELVQGMKDGKVHGIVLQDPFKMGYEAVMAMHKHLKNEKVDKRIQTGQYVATRENMDSEEIDRLLNPETVD